MRPTTHGGWGAVLEWYSLIHLAASELPAAIASLVRPRARTAGSCSPCTPAPRVCTITDWFGHGIDLDVVLYDPAEVVATVEAAGLVDVEWYHRGPLISRGEATQRLYALARKPQLSASSDAASSEQLDRTRPLNG